jgi:cation-transporting ATPase E
MKTFLTVFLAVVCILAKTPYFFTTNNMMMYEFLISAIPSFVISLQPNTERVRGRFIPFVISRALPGALTMGFAILSLFIINQTSLSSIYLYKVGGETESLYSAMLMLALTFTGLVMLMQICKPMNLIRSILFISMVVAVVIVLSVPFLGNIVYTGWGKLHFSASQILLMIVIVQASIPVSSGLIKFFDLFNPADD